MYFVTIFSTKENLCCSASLRILLLIRWVRQKLFQTCWISSSWALLLLCISCQQFYWLIRISSYLTRKSCCCCLHLCNHWFLLCHSCCFWIRSLWDTADQPQEMLGSCSTCSDVEQHGCCSVERIVPSKVNNGLMRWWCIWIIFTEPLTFFRFELPLLVQLRYQLAIRTSHNPISNNPKYRFKSTVYSTRRSEFN